MFAGSQHLTFVRKSSQHFSRLLHNHMQVTTNGRLLHGEKYPSVDSVVVSQPSKIQLTSVPTGNNQSVFFLHFLEYLLQRNIYRCYGDSNRTRFSQKVQFMRSRLNTLFVCGKFRMDDWYAIYLMVFAGALGIYFISIDLRGGFKENFDNVPIPVNNNGTKS